MCGFLLFFVNIYSSDVTRAALNSLRLPNSARVRPVCSQQQSDSQLCSSPSCVEIILVVLCVHLLQTKRWMDSPRIVLLPHICIHSMEGICANGNHTKSHMIRVKNLLRVFTERFITGLNRCTFSTHTLQLYYTQTLNGYVNLLPQYLDEISEVTF